MDIIYGQNLNVRPTFLMPPDATQVRPITSCGVRVSAGILPCRLVWKTRMVRLPGGEKIFEDMFIHFHRMYECTNVTDRQTDTAWRLRPRLHSIARQKSRSQPISGSIVCCERFKRQVQYTQLRQTMASWWHKSLISGGVCWWRETTTRQSVYDKKPQRYAEDNRAAFNCTQWQILSLSNNNRLRSRYGITLLKLTTDGHKASRGLSVAS